MLQNILKQSIKVCFFKQINMLQYCYKNLIKLYYKCKNRWTLRHVHTSHTATKPYRKTSVKDPIPALAHSYKIHCLNRKSNYIALSFSFNKASSIKLPKHAHLTVHFLASECTRMVKALISHRYIRVILHRVFVHHKLKLKCTISKFMT